MAKRPTRTNDNWQSFGEGGLPPLTDEKRVQASHQRLFGKGANVSAYEGKVFATPDERAWNQRPKSANAGKDIALTKKRPTATRTLSKGR